MSSGPPYTVEIPESQTDHEFTRHSPTHEANDLCESMSSFLGFWFKKNPETYQNTYFAMFNNLDEAIMVKLML